MFSLPGTPTIYYGEEIGMGEDLAADGRMAVRSPMQWSNAKNGGFSTAAPSKLIQRVAPDGYAPEHVNVQQQRHDPESLWNFMRKLISIRRTCSELGWGELSVIDQPQKQVLAHRCDVDDSGVVAVHNLSSEPVTVPLRIAGDGEEVIDLFSDELVDAAELRLEGYGFRWMRLRAAGALAIP